MMLEVRCCCRPEKLLGWLPVRDRDAWNGARVHFPVQQVFDYRGSLATFEGLRPELFERLTPPAITLTVGCLHGSRAGRALRAHLAFRSDETPLAVLRLVPGFVEHHPGSGEL